MALRALGRQSVILIDSEDDHSGEIELILLMQPYQFAVGADGSGTGGKTQDGSLAQFGPFANQSGDHGSGVSRQISVSLKNESR
jgi:hypothetical protein